jgi:hypothetical protein
VEIKPHITNKWTNEMRLVIKVEGESGQVQYARIPRPDFESKAFEYYFEGLNTLAAMLTQTREDHGFTSGPSVIPEKLMLIVTELAEVMEEHRKGGLLPNEVYLESAKSASNSSGDSSSSGLKDKPAGIAIEFADAVIRIFELCAACNIDIAHAIAIKAAYNEKRPHKHRKQY